MDVAAQLDAALATRASQGEKIAATLAILASLLTASTPPAPPPPAPEPLVAYARYILTNSAVPPVVARQVLAAFVRAVCGGAGVPDGVLGPLGARDGAGDGDGDEWAERGRAAFGDAQAEGSGGAGADARREVVEGVVGRVGAGAVELPSWAVDETTALRQLLSHILQADEDWEGAAKVLMGIPLENTSRMIPDEQKLDIYIKIVRLLLEAHEPGQAQTYFSRASLLMHACTSRATALVFKLCQARIFDYSRRFNEAAGRYHELSFDGEIAEEERGFMLSAAVTCAVLGPAGPQRARILANLYRDDRTTSLLAPVQSTILRKIFLDHILRPAEVHAFAAGLAEHQLARIAVDHRVKVDDAEDRTPAGALKGRKGPETVLDKAVVEHNIQACAKVYDDISFDGLGALLDLIPSAAEAMARQMIEQGRLRAWIDQVDRLIYFEGRNEQDADDLQGTAGGLGVEKEDKPIAAVTLTERWDERIKDASMRVERLVNEIEQRGLLKTTASANGTAAAQAVPMELT